MLEALKEVPFQAAPFTRYTLRADPFPNVQCVNLVPFPSLFRVSVKLGGYFRMTSSALLDGPFSPQRVDS